MKFHPPFFLFLAWRPSWLEVGITGPNFGRGLSKDHSTKVWFKLDQWLQRSWLKCEKLTDGRTTYDGHSVVTIAHMTLWVRWAKNVMARTRKYYLKNNYLTLRSKINVPQRSLWYATHRLMVMHPHTKYNWPIWKDKNVMVWTSFAEKKQKKRKRKKKSD